YPTAPASGQQALGEAGGMEWLEIVELLAGAQEPDRQAELAAKRRHGAATRAAIQLGDDEAGGRHGLGEEPALLDGVLSHRAVEHEQRFMGRPWQPPRNDPRDLLQLRHQALLRMQTPRRIDEHR